MRKNHTHSLEKNCWRKLLRKISNHKSYAFVYSLFQCISVKSQWIWNYLCSIFSILHLPFFRIASLLETCAVYVTQQKHIWLFSLSSFCYLSLFLFSLGSQSPLCKWNLLKLSYQKIIFLLIFHAILQSITMFLPIVNEKFKLYVIPPFPILPLFSSIFSSR